MSEEIEALKDAIRLSKEELLNRILDRLAIEEVSEEFYQELKAIVEEEDLKRFKYLKALEAQEVIEAVLKDKLK